MKKVIMLSVSFVILFVCLRFALINYKENKIKYFNDKKIFVLDSQIAYEMVERGDLKYFQIKKELGEKIAYKNSLGKSAIHRAVELRKIEIISFFIENKYDLNFVNDEGMLPIGIAAKNCDKEMVEILRKVSKAGLKDAKGNDWEYYMSKCRD